MPKTAISAKMLDIIAQRFRTLGEPCRLRLLQVLQTGEKTVGDLVLALEGSQPNISKHLQILYEAGLVSRRRQATSIIYAISDPMVFRICDLACQSAARKTRKQFQDLQPPSTPARRRSK